MGDIVLRVIGTFLIPFWNTNVLFWLSYGWEEMGNTHQKERNNAEQKKKNNQQVKIQSAILDNSLYIIQYQNRPKPWKSTLCCPLVSSDIFVC